MPFLAVGVEHRTSPLAVREAAFMDAETVIRSTVALLALDSIEEAAVLSTCNRTEVYLFAGDCGRARSGAEDLLAARDPRLRPYLRVWNDMEAAEHLFRVATGLESQSVGERQILTQVRAALALGGQARSIGPNLHSLFRSAISCARQARAGTSLGRLHTSTAVDAVNAAERTLGPLRNRTALVVGGGEVSRLAAEELRRRGTGRLILANRTESVAVELAGRLHATPARLDDLPHLLGRIDLLISATSAPHFILTADEVPADFERSAAPLEIIDLAMPRDIDPEVGRLPGIHLQDLEDLVPDGAAELWREDIQSMEAVIAAEVKEFQIWYLTRRVAPVIASLRAHVEAVSEAELKRIAPRLAGLDERERAAVDSLTGRLIDKMFHHLVLRLRLAAQSDPKLVEAAEFFFLHGEGGLFEHAGRSTSRAESRDQ